MSDSWNFIEFNLLFFCHESDDETINFTDTHLLGFTKKEIN